MWHAVLRWIASSIMTGLTLVVLAGLFWYGHHHNWQIPLVSKWGKEEPEEEPPPTPDEPSSVFGRAVKLSEETAQKMGLKFEVARSETVQDTLSAPAVLQYDQTLHSHLAPRASGTVWRVVKLQGDSVARGEVIAIIEAAEVGKAKSEFLAARQLLDLREKAHRRAVGASGTLPERQLADIEFAYQQARVQFLTAQQALINLGFAPPFEDWRTLSDEQLLLQLRRVGIPPSSLEGVRIETLTTNLLPMVSPLSGRVIQMDAGPGEAVSPGQPLCLIAALDPILLQMDVRPEEVGRLALRMPARFQSEGIDAVGPIVWISPEVDEKTRTVRVRAKLPNPEGKLRPHSFGTGVAILLERPGVVVPREAVQTSEGVPLVLVEREQYYRATRVTLGPEMGNFVAVTGVDAGDRVVTVGAAQLLAELSKHKIKGEE